MAPCVDSAWTGAAPQRVKRDGAGFVRASRLRFSISADGTADDRHGTIEIRASAIERLRRSCQNRVALTIHGEPRMTTAAQQTPPVRSADWIPRPLARLTVEHYEAMVNSGVFTRRDRILLINGLLVSKVTRNPPHVLAASHVRDELARLMPSGWHLRTEAPVRLPPRSECEPDVSVAREQGRLRDSPSWTRRSCARRRSRRVERLRGLATRQDLRARWNSRLLDCQSTRPTDRSLLTQAKRRLREAAYLQTGTIFTGCD